MLIPILVPTILNFKKKKKPVPQKKRNCSTDCVKAHIYSGANRDELFRDKKCGCFYCLKIFNPKEITEWCSYASDKDTAICPYCGIDSVIGESSGFPITKKFLEEMHNQWF